MGKFWTGYSEDRPAISKEFGLSCPAEDSVVQQSFAEECDINTIVKRFGLTGQLPDVVAVPRSGDFTGVTDFHSAMNLVIEAEAAFMTIPGELRRRFNHDPAEFLAFVEDPANGDEMLKMGLRVAPVPRETKEEVKPPSEQKE